MRTGRGTALHRRSSSGRARCSGCWFRPSAENIAAHRWRAFGRPDSKEAFGALSNRLVQSGVGVHALGLARHYVAEVLEALTLPSGNGFEHVDGPDGLGEAMGGVMAHLFGEVAHDATVRVCRRALQL